MFVCLFGGAGWAVAVAHFTEWKLFTGNTASFYVGKTELMVDRFGSMILVVSDILISLSGVVSSV